jgi:soluble lytic murein transglycosylase-like protein
MQVMPRYHSRKIREIGGSHQLFDPAKNIHVGSRILVNYLKDHRGNLRRALLKYNGSLGTRSSFPDRVLRVYRDLRRVTVEG